MTSTSRSGRVSPRRFQVKFHVRGHVADAALEVAPGGAEAVVGQELLEQEIERAAIGVAVRHDDRARAAERIDLEREELDFRVHADRVEEPPRDRAEESFQELRIGEYRDAPRIVGLDRRPQRGVQRGISEALLHLRDRLVDHGGVELEALDDVGLAAGPVAVLESFRGTPRDRAVFRVVAGERRDDRGRALGGARIAQRMLRIRASPNSLVFTSFAPSISRAKS